MCSSGSLIFLAVSNFESLSHYVSLSKCRIITTSWTVLGVYVMIFRQSKQCSLPDSCVAPDEFSSVNISF